MNVCILGCGPAGLLAAHAVEREGGTVTIISLRHKSRIPGAVFLHESIPGLSSRKPDGTIFFQKEGTKRGYAKKVYGNPDAPCSWDLFPRGERRAWSMFILYDRLWARFRLRIKDHLIHQGLLQEITSAGFDLVISAIPVPTICHNDRHEHEHQSISVLNRSLDPLLGNSIYNGVIYNGDSRFNWYRTSNIFGHEATESTVPFTAEQTAVYGARVSLGYKPLQTDCDCHPGIERVGRFGRWEKGVLVHHSYKQTIELMQRRKVQ